MFKCHWCGKELTGSGYRTNFCSRKCYEEYKASLPTREETKATYGCVFKCLAIIFIIGLVLRLFGVC